MTPLSILELVRVTQETDARGALNNARDLAAHAEKWGYRRIWVAEHHNMAGIASAATSVVIAHLAAGTTTIRVGAGGIMLPNHAPLCDRRAVRDAGAALSRAASTSASAARRAPISSRCAPCGARRRRPRPSRRTFWSCRPSSAPGESRTSASRRCRRPERKCRSGSSDRAISARCWPPSSGCLTRSRRISRPTI